jgi:DNA-binding NarL/FixJ family response regulator
MSGKLVYVSDNQDLTRAGIISLLTRYFKEEIVIEEVSYRDSLFARVKENSPFLVVIDPLNFDWHSPGDYVLLRKTAQETAILVISEVLTYSQAREIIDAGISYFLMKTGTEDEFFTAFKAITQKKKFISSEIYDLLLQREKQVPAMAIPLKLSPSEKDIARLIAEGKTTKEIAHHKNLSFHTINTHRKNIFRKLGINSSSELVKYVYNAGLSSDIEYHI